MNFDAVKHGAAVWKLLGVKWRPEELGNARVFQGWDAARLAGTLGLDAADVLAAMQGAAGGAPVVAPRRGCGGHRRAAPAGASEPVPVTPGEPVPPAGPDVAAGSLWAPRRLLAVRPYAPGGFTLDPREAAPGRVTRHVERADGVEVLAVRGGVVVAVVHPGDCDGPAVVLRGPLAAWGSMFRPV